MPIARLQRDIARDHQVALRIAERNAERDRQLLLAEIRRIWEHLLHQSGNGRGENDQPNA